MSRRTFIGNAKIAGEPPEVFDATAAAANVMGISPSMATAAINAAKKGDKNAQKQLLEAKRVYVAASRGDPIAQQEMAQIQADAKSGYAPAAQKAAFLSGAIGVFKGWSLFKKRSEPPKAAPPPPPAPRPSWGFPFLRLGTRVYHPYTLRDKE